jgi:hypothetical protein
MQPTKPYDRYSIRKHEITGPHGFPKAGVPLHLGQDRYVYRDDQAGPIFLAHER